ncbi:MAG: hypothetical protein VKK63_00580 [Synechococcus sp.]|nr:hypothetical protein [Synechococcus sp.]
MAAIVKANPSLTAGGLAVLKREYSTTDDGICNYFVDYCCLSQFSNVHIIKFRTGANPPTPIPAEMSLLPLASTPKLYDVKIRKENGITYFSTAYSAASLDAGQVITTETFEQRSFTATVLGTIRGNFSGFDTNNTGTVTQAVSYSFDYISKTVRVEASNPSVLPDIRGSVGPAFNTSVGLIFNQPADVRGKAAASTIDGTSINRTSRGQYTYSKTSSGIYVPVG